MPGLACTRSWTDGALSATEGVFPGLLVASPRMPGFSAERNSQAANEQRAPGSGLSSAKDEEPVGNLPAELPVSQFKGARVV